MTRESDEERRVWTLLTRDVRWRPPESLGVKVLEAEDADGEANVRLQLFEVAVAAIFARMRPDYEWYVSPNRPDGGLDFVGRNRFLVDETLGIAAAITVGGQCKKRTHVNDIVQDVGGSLIRMAASLNPTFFVVAFSARLTRTRVEEARRLLEQVHHRHCHILDREQIEGLFQDHLPLVEAVLAAGLSEDELDDVRAYLAAQPRSTALVDAQITSPDRVLAGVPFTVTLTLRSPIAAAPGARLWWRPTVDGDVEDAPLTLIGPIGADGPTGAALRPPEAADDPIHARRTLELISHAVGVLELGEIAVGAELGGTRERLTLGRVRVIENVRPRFFERPFRGCLERLSGEYERALARGVASVGVVGAGGSGKSRLCEEFALERRRRGAQVVTARQAKTLDNPHRVLAELLLGLLDEDASYTDPADHVIRGIQRFDEALAERAEPAIRSIFGSGSGTSGTVDEQSLLSSLVLLAAARGRHAALIVHLQDLHWCTADALVLMERFVWQLEQVLMSRTTQRRPESGVLFIFEGRIHERQGTKASDWTSEPFEAFVQRLDDACVPCPSFDRDDGLEFISRQFEDRYSARRLISTDLLELQADLVKRIDRAAGGNPFHSLEQLRLLKERRVIGQNPDTGLLYLIQPESQRATLPESVFDAIELRWRDIRARTPQLALLLWAAALVEDRLPATLFRRLRDALAPDVSEAEIDATDLLWIGDGDDHVMFRHENYFGSVRRFEVSPGDRERVVAVYSAWFAETRRRDPAASFRWALVLLELPEPDVARARRLLSTALTGARRRGDARLARRVAAASLNLTWSSDARSALPAATFVRHCDAELDLVRELLNSDRYEAARRLDRLESTLTRRLDATASGTRAATLERRALTAQLLRSQVLFNDRRPLRAAEIAERVVRRLPSVRVAAPQERGWDDLETEALHSLAVSLALAGEIGQALTTSERAVQLAERLASPALALHVVSTHANILLARAPERTEAILRQCLDEAAAADEPTGVGDEIVINLGMTLLLRAYQLAAVESERAAAMLLEARERLTRVFDTSFRLGRAPDAGAAALLLGLVNALEGSDDEVAWFAQAVAAAARGRQMETLWRAHVNLATALHRRGDDAAGSIRDHARAALEILDESLSPYSQPGRSARFRLVRLPLAQATRLLVLAGDDLGRSTLNRYPELRRCFDDVSAGQLAADVGERSHEWLRIESEEYVIY